MLRYEPIPELTRSEVETAIQRNMPEELLYVALSAALHGQDTEWAESVCVKLAEHPHATVRGNALLGFGHVARLHRRLDRARVEPLLEAGLQDPDEYVRGHAHDAIDDVEQFLGWRTARPNPLRDWMEGQPVEGVRFRLNDAVVVQSNESSGEVGAVVALLSMEPNPLYLVELGSGAGDLKVWEAELEPVG